MEPIDWFENWPPAPFNETYWGEPFSNAVIVFFLWSFLWFAPFWLIHIASMFVAWVNGSHRKATALLFLLPIAFFFGVVSNQNTHHLLISDQSQV
ncbi:MAG: hypothetical protein AAF830_08290, partial [Pseudomonadota bacterium]